MAASSSEMNSLSGKESVGVATLKPLVVVAPKAKNKRRHSQSSGKACHQVCFIRKKKGQKPTGALARVAKAIGYTSVHDLLEKGPEAVAAAQALRRSLKKRTPRYRVNNTFVEGRPHLLRDESTDASEGNIV
ncbi:hypothetical protein HU200_022894 [Digitaria exilis]|uniref:Zinc-finger domain-containing protein n=1 Tax=Digitaria exilis TaxID=1010633 RepID=A0A835C5T8_9POAL|nr:hypothetical protein HU200_022894 [Digitaria exilis]